MIICSSVFEDSCCRPKEEKLHCLQCGHTHTVHRNDYLTAVFVTKDPEVYHAHASHDERDGPNVFRDKLIAAGVPLHKYVHFEMVLITNGDVFADNSGWLNIISLVFQPMHNYALVSTLIL